MLCGGVSLLLLLLLSVFAGQLVLVGVWLWLEEVVEGGEEVQGFHLSLCVQEGCFFSMTDLLLLCFSFFSDGDEMLIIFLDAVLLHTLGLLIYLFFALLCPFPCQNQADPQNYLRGEGGRRG